MRRRRLLRFPRRDDRPLLVASDVVVVHWFRCPSCAHVGAAAFPAFYPSIDDGAEATLVCVSCRFCCGGDSLAGCLLAAGYAAGRLDDRATGGETARRGDCEWIARDVALRR